MPQLVNTQLRSSGSLDLSVVPNNTLSMRGDAFYSLVEQLTSKDIEELLKIQKISNVHCFLNTDPLAFFDINSNDPTVTGLQNRLSVKMLDGNMVVLAGVYGYVRYLRKLFDSLLMKKKTKRIYSKNSPPTNNFSHLVPSTPQASSVSIDLPTTTNLSNIDHQSYLNQKIKLWWEENRVQYDLENHVLTEPGDYQIIITDKSAIVRCCCNKKINMTMPKGRKYYQLSNFYKHLMQNGQCTAIKRKRAKVESDNDDDLIVAFSTSSSSNLSSQIDRVTISSDSQKLTESIDNSSHSISRPKRHRTS